MVAVLNMDVPASLGMTASSKEAPAPPLPPGLGFPPGLEPKTCDASCAHPDVASTRIGSTAGSTLMGTDVETDHMLKDLENFSNLLMMRLGFSQKAFEECDEDMAVALGYVEKQARELLEKAETVAKKLSCTDIHMQFENLPELLLAGHPDPESLLSSAEADIVQLKKDAVDMRSDYVQLLNKIGYLAKCADLSIFHALKVEGIKKISLKGTPRYIDASSLASFDDKTANVKHSRSPSPCLALSDRLEVGLGHLFGAEEMLKEPTEFWLTIHSLELDLGHMEEGLQCLALSAVPATA
eukprot:TRINITY_DN7434_c0_g1_i1.p1 TRINITY_DN7434_c0_g1~~TRINITY_DN7434_c0_g1_i1.p1  ORF type:complete len:297 (-),score=70.10 TRINITY_DN7434_c0_g1_i1:245-1135(-)